MVNRIIRGGVMVRIWPRLVILLIMPFFLTGCSLQSILKNSQPRSDRETDQGSVSDQSTRKPENQATRQPDNQTVAGVNLLTIQPDAEAIKRRIEESAVKAKIWQSDATLYHFAARIPTDLSIDGVTEVYTYGSPAEAYNWWTYNIALKTGKTIRALIPKEDYLGTALEPIPIKFWQTTYVEALQLADNYGGADFRAKNPEAAITVNLAVGQPKNYLWWTVEYLTGADEVLRILVNPSTKEVHNEAGQPLSPTVQTSP